MKKEKLSKDVAITDFSFNDQLKTLSSINFSEATAYRAADGASLITNYFNLQKAGDHVEKLRSDNPQAGIAVDRYKYSYKGIPVVHASYAVLSKQDKIYSIIAESYDLPGNFSIIPSVTKDNARNNALAFVNARKYAWQDLEADLQKAAGNAVLQKTLRGLMEEYYPKGELVIAKNLYGDGQARLAWKFDIYATDPVSRNYIFIDAQNGKMILKDAIIKHADRKNETTTKEEAMAVKNESNKAIKTVAAPDSKKQQWQSPEFWNSPQSSFVSDLGTAQTRYSGTRNIYTTKVSVPLLGANDPNNTSAPLQYSGVDPRTPVVGPIDVYILKDDTRGGGIETYDMNGVGGLPLSVPSIQTQALAFVDKDNIWKNETAAGTNEDLIRGATSNGSVGADEAANDDYAMDAHWGAEMVYDYWKQVHNRFSFDNLNSVIKSYVHYGPAYDNAFWNGSAMTYGDGSGTSAAGFRPLTSLDVCGHEIGHGVCSYTSDLVYASESGAMNEGLSDIWAACVERYVKVNVDPTVAYQYFQVGEQIAADNIGLRRMDNPKAKSDPDTYGGQYWQNPNCTPSLANDQCGVHSNSGVLNKWFYLLVQGPQSTTGSPAYTDDGLADNGAIINGGNNYGALGPAGTGEFLGLGFDKAEKITYLMELLLTPNATFAQARTASINAVRALYGQCTQEEKSVTDAWFAVNVGPSYTSCSLPVLSASTLQTSFFETAGGGCERFNEYNINTNLTVAQAATVQILFSVPSTTLSTDEYSLSSSIVTYNAGETGVKTVKLRIYDDAMIEADETITVDLNASFGLLNTSFTFTVKNDDLVPTIGATVTLLNEDFESAALGSVPAGWTQIDRTAPSPIKWAVRANGIAPLSWTGKRAIIEQNLLPGQASYDQLTTAQVYLKTPLINAIGLNTVRVRFTYQAGGEIACDPACDYGELVYSTDGTNFTSLPVPAFLYLQTTDTNFDIVLPGHLNGKQFYLGFLWYNDSNAGTSASITVDNMIVTAQGRDIETQQEATVSEKVNGETGKPSYFYSANRGKIIARILNNTAHNYGCVSTTLEKAGSNGIVLYNDGIIQHRVSDKIIRVTPTTNNPTGSYNITLYLTEAEITGLETYTGFTRTQFKVYKTSANPYSGANVGNSENATATYTAIAGFGGSFSANFNTGFSAFAVGAAVTGGPLPVSCIDFKAVKKGNAVSLNWRVGDEINNDRFEVERSNDGINFSTVATVTASAAANGNYSYTDNTATGARVYYRLKQIDQSGKFKYVCSVVNIMLDNQSTFSISNVFPNPTAGQSFVTVTTEKAMKISIEFVNTIGQVFSRQDVQLVAGSTRLALQMNAGSGTYIVRFRDHQGNVLGTRKFSRY